MELWDLYDNNRKPLNKKIKRGERVKEGEYYVAIEVWTINSLNQLLVTRRDFSKKAGGFWEFSGGGVLSGEKTMDAAKREVSEELGISYNKVEKLLYLTTCLTDKCFIDIFLLKLDMDIKSMSLQKGEVIDAKWVSIKEVEKMIETGEFVYSVGSRFNKNKWLLEERMV